jgi:GMP synthase (glutamine-hydrolysing)
MMKKLLVYNVMEFSEKIRFFNLGIRREVDAVGIEADYYVYDKDKTLGSIAPYSHLIISGSEASAMDESPWTEELSRVVLDFVAADKKILAICYGHQFLARVLCGKKCVVKMPVPEYGFSKIIITSSKLFDGITDPVVLELHHDAIVDLSVDFAVIAYNDKSIQAIQYKDMDVYGVQFHPEFDQKSAKIILNETRRYDLAFPDYYKNELADAGKLAQNSRFIRNFLMM